MAIEPSDDLGWPRKEPEKWRGFDCTRQDVRDLVDRLETPPFDPGLVEALDEIQGSMDPTEPDDVAYLLIRITKPAL